MCDPNERAKKECFNNSVWYAFKIKKNFKMKKKIKK